MTAKIRGDELDALRALVAPLDTDTNRDTYRRRDIPRADTVKDIDTRYRFDLFYAAQGWRALADGRKDAHIATALRTIIPSLDVIDDTDDDTDALDNEPLAFIDENTDYGRTNQ